MRSERMVDVESSQAAEVELQLRPFSNRQFLPMADERAQHAGVCDEGDGGLRLQRGREVDHPLLKTRDRLASWRCEADYVSRPGVEQAALDVVPGAAFPVAEVDLAQALVDHGRWMQRFCKLSRPAQRAGKDRNICRQQRFDLVGDGLRRVRVNVEAAVADAGFDYRFRVADQENLHNMPQSKATSDSCCVAPRQSPV